VNDWFEAEKRIERAQQLSESMRWSEALSEIDAALAINPNNGYWHAQRGFILEELDRTSDAVSAYERSLELEADEQEISLALGVALMRVGRIARALEIFESLARMYPDWEPAYCHRIAAYTELGRHDQAEQMFYMAQEIDDTCPHCFFHIAESLAIRGEIEKAIYCWQKVLDMEPDYVGVNRRIAQAHRANGDLVLAKEFFVRELRDDPGNTELLYELAQLALEAGEVSMASAKFLQILELQQDHVEARFSLGKISLAQDKPEEALQYFQAIEPSDLSEGMLPEFDRRVGEALVRLRRYDEAVRHLRKSLEADPENNETMTALGSCLLIEGKTSEAADCFRRVLAKASDHAAAHHFLAVCLLQSGQVEAAVEHCLETVRLAPELMTARCNAVAALMRLGRWSEARAMINKARALDPQNDLVAKIAKRMWRYRIGYAWRSLTRPFRACFGKGGKT